MSWHVPSELLTYSDKFVFDLRGQLLVFGNTANHGLKRSSVVYIGSLELLLLNERLVLSPLDLQVMFNPLFRRHHRETLRFFFRRPATLPGVHLFLELSNLSLQVVGALLRSTSLFPEMQNPFGSAGASWGLLAFLFAFLARDGLFIAFELLVILYDFFLVAENLIVVEVVTVYSHVTLRVRYANQPESRLRLQAE